MNINAQAIKKFRTQRNWTQQVLAEACDVSLRTIQRVERYGNASQETVMALAAVFEISQDEILVPETPLVEISNEKAHGPSIRTIQFAATFLSGIAIGAIIMTIFN
jgi:transcriptional regulator with XRE-family HTH domain